jgi:hypothetical protein
LAEGDGAAVSANHFIDKAAPGEFQREDIDWVHTSYDFSHNFGGKGFDCRNLTMREADWQLV